MRILREPLMHFLILGAVIFTISMFVGHTASVGTASDKQIVVTPDRVELLRSGFVLDYGRAPNDAELQRLIDAYVREEVLVREARAQGLDQDDSIVRRQLVKKMEFTVADPTPPADSVLADYLAQHPAAFRTPDGTTPALAQIHDAVLAAWMNDQRKAAIDEMYRKYLALYTVTVQTSAATKPAGAGGS